MSLVLVDPTRLNAIVSLAYATPENFTGRPIYCRQLCYLHPDAAAALERAVTLARALGLRLKIFDAFRPTEAQWRLWEHTPDPTFVADPRRGSPHSRGVAVDLTLVDAQGVELDMGTGFDDFSPRAFHGDLAIPVDAQRNRHLLLGIMSSAGWDFYAKEWWHYQLFNARTYPLYADSAVRPGLMAH